VASIARTDSLSDDVPVIVAAPPGETIHTTMPPVPFSTRPASGDKRLRAAARRPCPGRRGAPRTGRGAQRRPWTRSGRSYDDRMPDQRLLSVGVECYAGHRGEQTPRVLILGDRRIVVAEVVDAWLAPDHRYFKLRGADGNTYLVRQDERTNTWELTMFRAEHVDR
jgi:hypothetical protein